MDTFTLGEAGNTYNYALATIVEKGYKIFIVPDNREDEFGDYWAINATHRFVGSSPLVVLGLIGIWENYGNDWWADAKNTPKEYQTLIENRAFPNDLTDFENLSEEAFLQFVTEYKMLFEVLKSRKKFIIKDDITRKEMFVIVNSYWQED